MLGKDDAGSNGRDVDSIFCEAMDIGSESQRVAYLDRVCAGDREKRERVERLLAADANAGDFMREPAEPETAAAGTMEREGDRIGPYRLLQVIGQGGMGVVYMAEQTEPVERRVALKIIRSGIDTDEVIARFEAERQALAVMDHPNIARVLDAGQTASGRPYFVMELVKGTPITEYCDRKRLPSRERLELFIQVCNAAQHAHQKGIIHRDIKPANVLVAEYDHRPVPKIIDFGVAKATTHKLTAKTLFTQFGQIVGTLEYMSPEQAKLNQLDIDTRSDVYSLGVLLYELLTGTTPFDPARLHRAAFDEVLRIIREEDPPTPSARLSTMGDAARTVADSRASDARGLGRLVHGELDWIVMRCLDKERDRRYETANGLAADVRRYLSGEEVRACPPSATYRLRKFVARNRGAVLAAGALVLVLGLGLAGTTLGMAAAVDARDEQRQLNFRLALDRGLGLCDDGAVAQGMLWLARALELCPDDQPAMERAVRANLNAWSRELNTLEEVFPHDQPVICVDISPDGKHIATGSNDDTARVWDLRTGAPVGGPLANDRDVHEVRFSPDGSRLLTTDLGDAARLWDVASGALLRTFRHDDERDARGSDGESLPDGCGGVLGALFAGDDGSIVVTSCGNGVVSFWDAASGERLRTLSDGVNVVHDLDISADGRRLVTACHDKCARLWDVETGALLAKLVHPTRVPAAGFRDAAGTQIVTGDFDGNVYDWRIEDALFARGGEMRTFGTADPVLHHTSWLHRGGIHRLRVDRGSGQVLTAGFDKTARLWNPDDPVRSAAFEHGAPAEGVAFHRDGVRIAVAGDDGAAKLWRSAAAAPARTVEHDVSGHEAVYTADGRFILVEQAAASGDDGESIFELYAATGARIARLLHRGDVRSLAVSADGTRVLTGSASGASRLYESSSEHALFEHTPAGSGIWSVAFSADGTRTLVTDFDGTVAIRDAVTDAPIGESLALPCRALVVAFSPDGARFAVGGSDSVVRVYALDDLRSPVLLRAHRCEVSGLAFSRDGSRVVTGSQDGTVRVWDARTGEALGQPMPLGGPIALVSPAFSPDGRSVVTGSGDRAVRVWDVATSLPIGPARRHDSGVRMVAFPSDGEVRSGTTTGTVRIWHPVRTPLEGDVERIRLWLQVCTGFELSEDGVLHSLDAAAWRERRGRLTLLGGRPGGE